MELAAQTLAQWAAQFELGSSHTPALAKTKTHLLDFIGVTLGGLANEESARTAMGYARSQAGAPQATLWGSGGIKVPSESAAFAHAVAGHSIEMDDVHNASSLHPGVAVIPSALAVAEETGAIGRALFEAILVGYEIMLRVGEAAGPTAVYRRGFHPTAVCGVFASAAAAGKLMGLSPDQLAHALGLAWSFASGNMSFQTEGSWAKRIQIGNMARGGIQAARLAKMGAIGPARVFESDGFFHGYSGEFHSEKLMSGLGEKGDWLKRSVCLSPFSPKILECGIKPFACCRYNQTAIDLLIELKNENKIEAEQIESVRIEIPSTGLPLVALPEGNKRTPANRVEAQFSLYYGAAAALVEGDAGYAQYRDELLADPHVLALAKKIEAGSSEAIDRLYPKQWGANVRIILRDGKILERMSAEGLGDPGKPLTQSQLEAKFKNLSAKMMPPERQTELIEWVANLESSPSLKTLPKLA